MNKTLESAPAHRGDAGDPQDYNMTVKTMLNMKAFQTRDY